ncbi:MAG: excinuclease ABC subunit UvrC [Syntrophales bacterium]
MIKSPMQNTIESKTRNIPRASGVYIMKDKNGRVIYVGKARDLKNRLRNYFGGTDSRFMIPFLVSKIHDLDYIITDTEKEALILENNLIKEHRPRYNVIFRDDKAYFNIRINMTDTFPRFQLVRRAKKDGARYFGPYPSSASAKETLHFIQQIFPLRTCGDKELKSRKRPCLEYQIRRCLAPCVDLIDSEAYRRLAKDGMAFLIGRENKLIADLRSKMNSAAEHLNFEEAAVVRDRIAAIENTLEKQRIVSMSFKDQDVFGLYRQGNLTQICALYIRKGKLIGSKAFPLFKVGIDTSEILSSLLKQYYDGDVFIPQKIVVSEDIEDEAVIEEWLTEKKGKAVSISVPIRGQGRGLIRIAQRNAENICKTKAMTESNAEEAIMMLAEHLHLRNLPERIECFDISNIGGQYAVGSMVTFVAGVPWKQDYKRFKIKTVVGADDYGMMYEVLKRRYKNSENLPDLIVVDGGKGQLGVAVSVLNDTGIEGIDVVGLAKGEKEDRVYRPRRKDHVQISKWPAAMFLLQRIRDEAHRFAVSYHRKLKEKGDFQSVMDEIPGIGKDRKNALLTFFGDIKKIRNAGVEALQQVEGIGTHTAEKIYAFFKIVDSLKS